MTKWSPASLSCKSGWDWVHWWRWMCMHAISQSNLIWWWSCNWSNFSIHPQIQLQSPANYSAALRLDPPTLQTCHFQTRAEQPYILTTVHLVIRIRSFGQKTCIFFSFSPLSVLGVPLMWSPGKFAPRYPKKWNGQPGKKSIPAALVSFPDRRFCKFWERDLH